VTSSLEPAILNREKSHLKAILIGQIVGKKQPQPVWLASKNVTSNGVFRPKKPQFRIVDLAGFSYIFCIRCHAVFYQELHHYYAEYF